MRTAVLFGVLCTAGCTAPNEDFVAAQDSPPGSGSDATYPAEDGGAALDLAPFVPQPDLGPLPDLDPPCGDTLAQVGAGDFTIRFLITTRAVVQSTVLYQRLACDGASSMLDIQMLKSGALVVVVGQGGGDWTSFETSITVNDGKPHDVVMRRKAARMTTTTDGVDSGGAPVSKALGDLPPIGVASGNPCEPFGLTPLVGAVTGVCVTAN